MPLPKPPDKSGQALLHEGGAYLITLLKIAPFSLGRRGLGERGR